MPALSPTGVQLVQNLAQRHGVSTDAVTHMLISIQNGNGTMAQFNHHEFGGAGQWMRGGMTMVSDLFNNQLKCRVDNVCSDISNELANHQVTPFSGSFQSQSQNGASSQSQAGGTLGSGNSLFAPDPEANWWPQNLGVPNAIGSQNQVRYAYFAQGQRLAVKTAGDVWVYDTLNHQIGGFSQQQGSGGSITFTSQFGIVNLSTLPVVTQNGVAPVVKQTPLPVSSSMVVPSGQPSENEKLEAVNQCETPAPAVTNREPAGSSSSDSIIATLERLGGLRDKGYVSEEEFAAKKADLLSRL